MANSSFSQINQTNSIVSLKQTNATNKIKLPQLKSVAQSGEDVIWCENFENGLDGNNDSNAPWTTAGPDGNLWLHDLDGSSGQYSVDGNGDPTTSLDSSETAEDGWMIFDTDLSNPGMVVAQYVERRGQLISPYIDLSSQTNVSLRFDQSYRWCCDGDHQLNVGFSIDQGQNWTDFQINENVNTNETVENEQRIIILPSNIVGQDSVLIRFDWGNGEETASHYFWMIDDVTLFETPANASSLTDAFVRMPSELFGSAEYTNVPLAQAQEGGIFFGGIIFNTGVNDLVNTKIVGEVISENFSDESISVTLETNEDSSLFTQNGFTPTSIGEYISNIYGESDSTTTEAQQISFIVSEYEYALDYSDYSISGMFNNLDLNDMGSVQIGNVFEIYESQDLYSVKAYIHMETDAQAQARAIINSFDNQGMIIFEAQSELINIGQHRGDWVDFIISSPSSPYPTFEGQTLVATIQAEGTDPLVSLGISGVANRTSYLLDIDGSNQNGDPNTWYTMPNIPMVRLNFDPSIAEQPANISEEFLSDFSVYPNPSNGSFQINISSESSKDLTLSIQNILGQDVYYESLESVVSLTKNLNLTHLEKGIYQLIISERDEKTLTQKIIIQ
jgi:hypothetical protein